MAFPPRTMPLLLPLMVMAMMMLSGLCQAQSENNQGLDNENTTTMPEKEDDVYTTILKMNNESMEMLLEGDLMLPNTRNAMKCHNGPYQCLWPKSANGKVEIPYIIGENYDNEERATILNAMKGFADKTCIRFVPRRNERAYLSIEARFGCKSLMGRTGEKQAVVLQRLGCTKYRVVQHELLHAMGFYHEHTRSDRDEHVKINWDNIVEYYKGNFRKMDTNNLDTPYDYDSVMHYGRTAFGKGREETMTPIPNTKAVIGEAKGLSDIDVLRVNRLYRC